MYLIALYSDKWPTSVLTHFKHEESYKTLIIWNVADKQDTTSTGFSAFLNLNKNCEPH